MEKLTIQDLAMFIGCNVQYNNSCNYTLIGVNHFGNDASIIKSTRMIDFFNVDIGEIKPILRPLSDMTEEERKNYVGLQTAVETASYSEREEAWIFTGVKNFDTPKSMQYLLSIGVDLFNWIEKGLAIDKTTLCK